MPPKVHIAFLGIGFGHAIRMRSIAEKLRERGFQITFSTSGEPAAYFSALGLKGWKLEELAPLWTAGGSFSFHELISQSKNLSMTTYNYLKRELSIIESVRPDILIADSRLDAILAGKLFNIPTVAITNQLRILATCKRRNKSVKGLEEIEANFMGLFWRTADELLFPDLPPPNTVSEENLCDIAAVKGKAKYTGFISAEKIEPKPMIDRYVKEITDMRRKFLVFVPLSGPMETIKPVLNPIIEAAKRTSHECTYFISLGQPNGMEKFSKIEGGILCNWCEDANSLFSLADAVIVRGGHSSIANGIIYEKPMLVIPIQNHTEQYASARKVHKLGIGRTAEISQLDGEYITQELRHLLYDNSYKENIKVASKVASKMNGTQYIVEKVAKYC